MSTPRTGAPVWAQSAERGTWLAEHDGAVLRVSRVAAGEWRAGVTFDPGTPRERDQRSQGLFATRLRAQRWAQDAASAPVPGVAGTAAGIVKIRLSGAPTDVAHLTELLLRLAHGLDPAAPYSVEVLEHSAPYPNRRDLGERVYLTLRVGRDGAR